MKPLFLEPVFQEKIWGGRKLEQIFGSKLPAGSIGECWSISAHPHGRSKVINGEFVGEYLDDLWEKHPELFGNPIGKKFPLLTKILDAEDSLSVQVHPDDEYAMQNANERGKTECWYVIDADPGSELIYGHTAKTHEQLNEMIDAGDWDNLLRRVPVKKGDFFFVPSGTVHALNRGITVLETQQSSDTTYRLYDYDRVDKKTGKKRELHLQQSKETINVPHHDPAIEYEEARIGNDLVRTFVKPPISPFFEVSEWRIKDGLDLSHNINKYTLATVIDGTGKLKAAGEEYDLKIGDSFIIPAQIESWTITGDIQIIASESGEA